MDEQVLAALLRWMSHWAHLSASHDVSVQQAPAQLQPPLDTAITDFDIQALPTVPVIAPTIASLDDEETFHCTNMLVLRNPSVFNFYDQPAVSLPLPRQAGEMPRGFDAGGQGPRRGGPCP